MLESVEIPGIDSFSSLFSSNTEMFFYIFCFIAFHMIIINLFYGRSKRVGRRGYKVKRTLIIIMAMAEIAIFSSLLTRDNIYNTMSAGTNGMYQKAKVHQYSH